MRSWLLLGVLLTAAPRMSAALTFIERAQDGAAGVDGLAGAVALALSPGGEQLYVAGPDDDAVAVFGRDPVTGRLTYVQAQRNGVGGVDGLSAATAVALSSDGHHVYVAGSADDAVAVFARDAATGVLTFVEVARDAVGGVTGLGGASAVAVSPDGAHVYATGRRDGTVAIFVRDTVTGMLGFAAVVQDGVAGVDGIAGASALAPSPDGQHLYVTGADADAVAVFTRDAGTGALTFVAVKRNGVVGVNGLDAASSVAVTPDGARVYITGPNDDAVAVFLREAGSGILNFVERQRDGTDGVDGLNGAAGVTVSPDGTQVYVAGRDDDALVLFAPAPATGGLTFLEQQRDGQGGIDGLAGASAAAVSPDAAFVYVAGTRDNSVAVFSTATTTTTTSTSTTTTTLPPCAPAPRSGCRVAGQSLLVLRARSRGVRELLRWRWQGPSAGPIDFGDPRRSTAYTLCVYDARPGSDAALLGAVARAGGRCNERPCWRALDNLGYRYRNQRRTPHGIARIVLRSTPGSAQITVAGRGPRLRMPALPLVAPLTVQLLAAEAACWEATYVSPAVNGPRRVTARTP